MKKYLILYLVEFRALAEPSSDLIEQILAKLLTYGLLLLEADGLINLSCRMVQKLLLYKIFKRPIDVTIFIPLLPINLVCVEGFQVSTILAFQIIPKFGFLNISKALYRNIKWLSISHFSLKIDFLPCHIKQFCEIVKI